MHRDHEREPGVGGSARKNARNDGMQLVEPPRPTIRCIA